VSPGGTGGKIGSGGKGGSGTSGSTGTGGSTIGTGGKATGGTPGSGGQGGTVSSGGVISGGGTGGVTSGGTGGIANGGTGGGSSCGANIACPGTGGTGGTGGVGGLGGVAGLGGTVSIGGTGGGASGPTPLKIQDLQGINTTALPGFDAAGFRAKALNVCGTSQMTCTYTANLGYVFSQEPTYYDGSGTTLVPVKIVIGVGAASQCGDPNIQIASGQYITITYDGGKMLAIPFPAFCGKSLTLYVAANGATFYDPALTQLAHGAG
jgi:hypothetical protein